MQPGMVVHTYNPCYSGGKVGGSLVQGQWEQSYWDPISETKHKQEALGSISSTKKKIVYEIWPHSCTIAKFLKQEVLKSAY
jgi:hypothetical protein